MPVSKAARGSKKQSAQPSNGCADLFSPRALRLFAIYDGSFISDVLKTKEQDNVGVAHQAAQVLRNMSESLNLAASDLYPYPRKFARNSERPDS